MEKKVNLAATLSYLSILVLIPYLIEKKDYFIIYHAKQGLKLFILEIIVAFLEIIIFSLKKNTIFFKYASIIRMITNVLFTTISLIGIVNVCRGEKKELPIIGKIKM